MTSGDYDVNDEVLGTAVMTLLERNEVVSALQVRDELLLMAENENGGNRKHACIWMASWVIWLEKSANPPDE